MSRLIYTCFVDFTKAFESVWRDGLFQKLHLGINGNIFKIIKHMCSTTQFWVRKDNFISNPIANNKGVKQGYSLSPTLFNIYINDLGSYVNEGFQHDPVFLGDFPLNHLLFADDLLLLSQTSGIDWQRMSSYFLILTPLNKQSVRSHTPSHKSEILLLSCF